MRFSDDSADISARSKNSSVTTCQCRVPGSARGLPDMSAMQCRTALRELWKDLVIRRVFKTIADDQPRSWSLVRLMENGGRGTTFMALPSEVDQCERQMTETGKG